jgi:hypothetical protein
MIPKILLQTSKLPYPEYVQKIWQERVDKSWAINWFNDKMIIQYFKDNPLPEFPNVVDVFNSFSKGAHKADLFRYYYLYQHGGFFVDSDMMVHVNMNNICAEHHDHVFVIADLPMLWESDPHPIITPPHVFNALIGCIPKSEIIYEALTDLYNVKPRLIDKHYFYVVYKLYVILQKHKNKYNVLLFNETQPCEHPTETHTVDDSGNQIATHYYTTKEIPA